MICRPTGKLSLKPQGTERAGNPVKLLGPVKRMILSIKSTFSPFKVAKLSPMVLATTGNVGDINTST
ncbi:hypothetical protein D3C79_1028910 [compost metagenome]